MDAAYVPPLLTALGSGLVALGAYWARHTDRRLEALEDKEQETGERLARLEAISSGMDKKLDYIMEKLDG